MMTIMMKKMSQSGGRNFGGMEGIPPELFNNLKQKGKNVKNKTSARRDKKKALL